MKKRNEGNGIKHRRALRSGSRAFGYSRTLNATPERPAHVETTVNESEARAVRSIFEHFVAGGDQKMIAQRLNEQAAAMHTEDETK